MSLVRRTIGWLGLGAVCGLAGCVTWPSQEPEARPISLADFRAADGQAAEPGGGTASAPLAVDPVRPIVIEADPGGAAPAPVAPVPPRPLQPGESTVVDSLIGQVNGRPIFAEPFFEPIEDQLMALAERLSAREWVLQANQIIGGRLFEVVRDELFLSEAMAALTEQEQAGLLSMLQGFEEETIRKQGGGGQTAANRELLEREGVTLEDLVEERERTILIRQLLYAQIAPRVIVSWRDVENEYARRFDEFNPAPRVHLARVSVRTTDAEGVADVQRRLSAGEDFAQVAESRGFRDGGAFDNYAFGDGGISDIAEEALNPILSRQLAGLEVGQTTAPFELGSSTWWLHVAAIDQAEPKSIYDVQLQLMNELRSARVNIEQDRYIQSLFEHGSQDDLNQMQERLLDIAVQRYGR